MAKNLRLICETSNIETKKKDRKLYIIGVFQQAEKKNKNGRFYPKKLLSEQIQRLQPKIDRKALFGQLGHPTDPTGNPSRISHRIDELRWSGNDLYGRALVLDTAAGRDLKAIISAGSQIMISSRGVGSFDPDTGAVEEDFRLLSFDVVETGSVSDAFVSGVFEHQTWSPCQIARIFEEQDHYSDFVSECICPNCEIYSTHRNKKCESVKCEYCQMKLKGTGKVYDGAELFKNLTEGWVEKIREKEGE